MIRASWLLVALALLFGPVGRVAYAQDKAKELFDKMEAKVLKSNTFQADFDLAITDSKGLLSTAAPRKGRLIVAKGNKLWLTVDGKDVKQNAVLMISDGTKMFESSSLAPTSGFPDTPKKLTRMALTMITRFGIWMALNTLGTDDVSASDFKLGKKEKVAGKDAQAITYKLRDKADKKELWAVTVWLDAKTNLPFKHVSSAKEGKDSLKVTENYTNVVLDATIDAKKFELPWRSFSMNNLKNIGLGMQDYHATFQKFPSAAICDKDRKPLLSWRVALLPYVEANNLYTMFKLDQPWDSDHNKKLIALMPDIYAVPGGKKPGETALRVLVGAGAGFEWSKSLKVADITDGTANTLMVVEAAETVPWTKPDELVYDAQKPLPKFGNFHGDGKFLALFFDGQVRSLSHKASEATLRALITRAGADMPGRDFEP